MRPARPRRWILAIPILLLGAIVAASLVLPDRAAKKALAEEKREAEAVGLKYEPSQSHLLLPSETAPPAPMEPDLSRQLFQVQDNPAEAGVWISQGESFLARTRTFLQKMKRTKPGWDVPQFGFGQAREHSAHVELLLKLSENFAAKGEEEKAADCFVLAVQLRNRTLAGAFYGIAINRYVADIALAQSLERLSLTTTRIPELKRIMAAGDQISPEPKLEDTISALAMSAMYRVRERPAKGGINWDSGDINLFGKNYPVQVIQVGGKPSALAELLRQIGIKKERFERPSRTALEAQVIRASRSSLKAAKKITRPGLVSSDKGITDAMKRLSMNLLERCREARYRLNVSRLLAHCVLMHREGSGLPDGGSDFLNGYSGSPLTVQKKGELVLIQPSPYDLKNRWFPASTGPVKQIDLSALPSSAQSLKSRP